VHLQQLVPAVALEAGEKSFFATCIVMVEAPCCGESDAKFDSVARTRLRRLMPSWEKNSLSSTTRNASITGCGMSSKAIGCEFSSS